MPATPPKPCSRPGCPHKAQPGSSLCHAHRKQIKAQYEQERLSSSERGYSGHWRIIRARKLRACPVCEWPGCKRPAEMVHHRDGDSRNNASVNLMSICRAHHEEIHGPERFTSVAQKPSALMPSVIPLTIVYGPPGAGKTTYVKQHSNPGDIVIDLDAISIDSFGKPLARLNNAEFKLVMAERNKMLFSLSFQRRGAAWFIISAPKRSSREFFESKLKPIKTIMLEVLPDECISRIENDKTRNAEEKEKSIQGVLNWWSKYTRSRPRGG